MENRTGHDPDAQSHIMDDASRPPEMEESLLTPTDDGFHRDLSVTWQTEGSWWCFFHEERRLAGWIYHLTRTTLGVASGGVWIWDDQATQWYEAPYFMIQNTQPITSAADLRSMRWPDGVALTALKPLQRYRLTYDDSPAVAFDLEYQSMMSPYETTVGFPPAVVRFEQPSTVTGHLRLRNEVLAIDCMAMWDHSWGDRPEPRTNPTRGGTSPEQLANRPAPYLWGTASASQAFFVMGNKGYFVADGARSALLNVEQLTVRRPGDGMIESMTVTGVDEIGRTLKATGHPVNLLIRPSAGSSVGFIYTMKWHINGVDAVGDVQDAWPVEDWSAYRSYERRALRG